MSIIISFSFSLSQTHTDRQSAMKMSVLKSTETISYIQQKTNDFVRSLVICLMDSYVLLLAAIKLQKLVWFDYVLQHVTLPKTVLQSCVEGGQMRIFVNK